MNENDIGKIIVDCAIHLHMDFGPGLLETGLDIFNVDRTESQGFLMAKFHEFLCGFV